MVDELLESKLEKLKSLYEKNLIDEEEYKEQRKTLLTQFTETSTKLDSKPKQEKIENASTFSGTETLSPPAKETSAKEEISQNTFSSTETISPPQTKQEPPTQKLPAQTFAVGDLIGDKYRIIEPLGKGGMGMVYKVEHLQLSKIFALKILHSHMSEDLSIKKRFIREMQAALEFSHEHALQVRDYGEVAGVQYFTMDFSDGIPLKELIKKEGILDEKRALTITTQILNALKNAHKQNIIHRDLKPANILVEKRFEKDHALVLDFGIAKIECAEATELTQGVIGTPQYMSPEQARQKDVDTRSDLFSVGIILYEMVTGKLPYTGNTLVEILFARILKDPIPIEEVNPKVSPQVTKIIYKVLQKEKEDRFDTAEEFIQAIEECHKDDKAIEVVPKSSEIIKHEPQKATEKPKDSSKKKKLALFGVCAVLLLLMIVIVDGTLWNKQHQEDDSYSKKDKEIRDKTNKNVKKDKEIRDKANKAKQKVTIYTHRHYSGDKALFEQFTKETGIEVVVLKSKANELIKKIEIEGDKTEADLLITVGVGRLHLAQEKGLLQGVSSETLTKNVPKHLREKDGYWYALTKHASVFIYHTGRLTPGELPTTYEDLAAGRWRRRTAISSSIYQSLLASIVVAKGKDAALEWAKGITANMLVTDDYRDQVKAVTSARVDLAVVNTYYIGKLLKSKSPHEVKVFFPNQNDRGTHVNISGAGITKHAKNKDNALKLLEFLTSKKAQQTFAQENYEYPVHPKVQPSELVASWGKFKEDKANLSQLAGWK